MDKSSEHNPDNRSSGPTEESVVIPDKLYFKIGEVCEITGIKQHVLRYWESEFRMISPQRARSKQRLYRRADVENILKIKRLLKDEGFTISGAKKLLKKKKSAPAKEQAQKVQDPESFIHHIREELEAIEKIISRTDSEDEA